MPKKILAASPHQAFAELLRASLETGGQYSVNVVQSGAAASAAAATQAYDLAILDLELVGPVDVLIHDLRFKQPGLPLIFVPPENKLAPPEMASIPNHSTLTRPFYLPDLLSKVESTIGPAHNMPLNGAGLRPIPDSLDWLQDPELCSRRLSRVLQDATADGMLVVYAGQVLARAGSITPAEIADIAAFIKHNWDAHSERDLARFMHSPVKAHGYFLYITRLVGDLALAGVFGPSTPLSHSRAQTRKIANAILQLPPAPRPTLNSLRDSLNTYAGVQPHPAATLSADSDLPEDEDPDDSGGLSEAEQISLNELLSGMPDPDPVNLLNEAAPPSQAPSLPKSTPDWSEEPPAGAAQVGAAQAEYPALSGIDAAAEGAAHMDAAAERQWWETDDLFGELGSPHQFEPAPPAETPPVEASAADTVDPGAVHTEYPAVSAKGAAHIDAAAAEYPDVSGKGAAHTEYPAVSAEGAAHKAASAESLSDAATSETSAAGDGANSGAAHDVAATPAEGAAHIGAAAESPDWMDFRPAPFLSEIKPAQPAWIRVSPEINPPEEADSADLPDFDLTPGSSMFSSFSQMLDRAIASPAAEYPASSAEGAEATEYPALSGKPVSQEMPPQLPQVLTTEVPPQMPEVQQNEASLPQESSDLEAPEVQPQELPQVHSTPAVPLRVEMPEVQPAQEPETVDPTAMTRPVLEPERKLPGFSVPDLDEGLPAPPQYGLFPWEQEENPLLIESPAAQTQVTGAPITDWPGIVPGASGAPVVSAGFSGAAANRPSDPDDTRPTRISQPSAANEADKASGPQEHSKTGPQVITRVAYTCLLIPRVEEHYLDGKLADFIAGLMPRLCQAFGWALLECVVRPEYLQWTVEVTPAVSPGNLVRIARQRSSEDIFRFYPYLLTLNMSGDFWAPGYLVVRGIQFPSNQLLRDFIYQTRRRQGLLRS